MSDEANVQDRDVQPTPTILADVATEKELDDFLKGTARVIVYFWTTWAPPCAQMNEVYTTLHKQHSTSITFVRVDSDANRALAARYLVKTVPTFLFFGNERVARRITGANAPALTKAVTWMAGATADALLTAACETLIARSDVMLFMKGSVGAPKCAFCRRVIDSLRRTGVVFDAFDVLLDSKVRERVTEVACWETFPMLFARGRLIGGVDAVDKLVGERRLVAELARNEGEPAPAVGADEGITTVPSPTPVATPPPPPKAVAAKAEAAPKVDGKAAVRTGGEAVGGENGEDALRSRLEGLVRREDVMLFMKGSPSEPRCGFSRRMVDVLRRHDVTYGHFDILEDNAVRQGLKTFSQWPTYPQLYVRGRFVGGLDVVNELADLGELSGELEG